ncbi:MAG: type II secretion system F family protein [Candidatus Aminicenantes bacterium]|nr:type II secretion system F family protein [Candidatus Aminicenantes bacterium]
MPSFLCRLTGEDGRVLVRKLAAASAADVRRHFESEGLCVLGVKRDWSRLRLSLFEGRINPRDFIMFNQELMALLRAGYPALRSLEVIAARAKSPALRDVLGKVEEDIRHGKSISEAFAPFEKRFSKIYTAALTAGEQSGNLPETIGQYVQYAKRIDQTRRRVRSAMTYPTLLFFFAVGLLLVILNFVLPNFSDFYADFESQLPLVTVLLIDFSMFVRRLWWLWLLLIVFLAAAVSRLKRREDTLVWLERQKLRLPLGRLLWRESGVGLFSRTLSLLLGAGVSLVPAVGLAAQAIPNKYLAARASAIPAGIKNGETLSEAMAKTEVFPSLALDMVRIGETSANLAGMLREAAEVYEERVQSKIDTLVSLVEPVIIIFVGFLVALMLLAVYLPIFNIIKVAR